MIYRAKNWILSVRSFLRFEALGGILVALGALLGILSVNLGEDLRFAYQELLHSEIGFAIHNIALRTSLEFFVADGLMALFFLVVGLELKREYYDGELSNPMQRYLPVSAAAFGVLVPALVYLLFNWNDALTRVGWAIPCATDIAFSLAVLRALGSSVPLSLKIFLATLGVVDDLISIVILAIFYSTGLHFTSLLWVAVVTLFLLGFARVTKHGYLGVYLLGGVVLWFLLHASGIHPTLSGVIIALCVPREEVHRLEKALHGWVAYGIVPLFAYLSSGLVLEELSLEALLHSPLSLGIIFALLLGKPIGITLGVMAARAFSGAPLPSRCSYAQIVGVGIIGGIGFTMSIFVSGLSFGADTHHHLLALSRGGIFAGSIVSAILGAMILKIAKPTG